MSVRDFIKNSVLNADSYSQVDIGRIALSLITALILGILIYLVYRKFYAGVVYSKSFAVTLIGMCVLTCMVTLAISTNIVISLGMVGALSIVRFRTAVKDPLDLFYLFWSITGGITAGAGMYILTMVASIIVIINLKAFSDPMIFGTDLRQRCLAGWKVVHKGRFFFANIWLYAKGKQQL